MSLFLTPAIPLIRCEDTIIASVVPSLTERFEEMVRAYLGRAPLVVGTGTRTGVAIRYDRPQEVGADRIVNVAAAFRQYGGPACVVDFGTGTTFDALSATGEYLGGAIAPGVRVAAEALFQRTAKLPRIDLQRPPHAIGANTVTRCDRHPVRVCGPGGGPCGALRRNWAHDMRVDRYGRPGGGRGA